MTENLERIARLKERMSQLEEHNSEISISNDQAKPDALSAIQHAREVEVIELDVMGMRREE